MVRMHICMYTRMYLWSLELEKQEKQEKKGMERRGEESRGEERGGREYARPLAFIGVHLSQGT